MPFFGKVDKGIRESEVEEEKKHTLTIGTALRFKKKVIQKMKIQKSIFLKVSLHMFHTEFLPNIPQIPNRVLNILGVLGLQK